MACSNIFLYLLFASALAPAPISGLLVKQDSQVRSNATMRKHACIDKFGMCLYPCTCVRIFHFSDMVSEQESYNSDVGTYIADVRMLEDQDKKLTSRDMLKSKRKKDAFYKDSAGKATMVWSEYKLQKLKARWGSGAGQDMGSILGAASMNAGFPASPAVKKAAEREKMGGLLYLKTALSEQKQKAVTENYSPITTFGGDFLGPNYLSTFYTAGLHMIEAFNHLEVDMVVMGNHDLESGMKTALRGMRCSRFAWLTANIREMYPALPLRKLKEGETDDRAPIEGGVIGNNYVRKGIDWRPVKSVLDGKDFPYQPPNGLFEIRIDTQIGALKRPSVKLCFAGLTSYSSGALQNYKNVFLPKRAYVPSAHLKTTGHNAMWKPSHWPDNEFSKSLSVEALFESCPVHLTSGRQPEGENVDAERLDAGIKYDSANPLPEEADYDKYTKEKTKELVRDIGSLFTPLATKAEDLFREGKTLTAYKLDNLWSGTEANGYFDFFNDYKFVVPSLLKEAFDAGCHSFVLLTHMKAADDSHILKIAEEHHQGKLLNAVLGGGDHAPYIHFKGFEDTVPETMVVKTGMNGAFLARMDLKFVTEATNPAYFDHTVFDFKDPDKPASIVPVGKYLQEADAGMDACLKSFNRLTGDEEGVLLAQGWVGDYDTYSIKNRQTRAADFYVDILRNWGAEKMAAQVAAQDERIFKTVAGEPVYNHLIAFMHASALRGAQYERYSGRAIDGSTYPSGDKQFSMLQLRTEFQKDSTPILFTMTAQDFLLAMITYVAIPNSVNFPILAGSDITLDASSSSPNRLAYFRRDSYTKRNVHGLPITEISLTSKKKQSITMATLWNDKPDDTWLMDAVLPSDKLAIASTMDAYNQMTRTLIDVWKVVLNFATKEAQADPEGFGQEMLNTYELVDPLDNKKASMRKFSTVAEGKGHREALLSQEAAFSIFERFHRKDKACFGTEQQECFDPILSGFDCENPPLAHVQTLGSWNAAAKSVQRPCTRVRKGDAPADTGINFMDQDAVKEYQEELKNKAEAMSANGIKNMEQQLAALGIKKQEVKSKEEEHIEKLDKKKKELEKKLEDEESQMHQLRSAVREEGIRSDIMTLERQIMDAPSHQAEIATELAELQKEVKEQTAKALLSSIEASQSRAA